MHRAFLEALWGGIDDGFILIWIYDGDKRKESFWFQDWESAAAKVEQIKDEPRVNCYMGVGLSPQDYGSNRRCLKKDIAGIAGLWLDIDIKSPEHRKPNLPETIQEAESLLEALPVFMQPSIVLNSGHGLQAWWLFNETWTFDSATERADAEQLERRFIGFFKQRAQLRGWDVDSVYNLDRVLRVPGTTNNKGEPVPVVTLEQNDRRYSPSDFEAWLPELVPELAAPATPGTKESKGAIALDAQANPPFDRFNAMCDMEPKFRLSWEKQRKDLADQSASSYDLSLARFAYMYGWTDQEVANLLIAFRRKHGDELKLRQDYYQRTLGVAKRGLEKQRAQDVIDGYVESQNPDEHTKIESNEKEAIMQSLSALFDVTIIQIIKFVADPPIYKLKTSRGDITLGEVANLIGQPALRTHLAAATGKYLPRFKAERWDNIAQALLDCCYEVTIGDEATEAGEMRSWLIQYLDSKPPYAESETSEAILNQAPVHYKGRLALFGSDLRRWLRTAQQEKITAKRMGLMLRAVGCEPDKIPIDADGRRSSRSVWFLPKNMTEGEWA